MEKSNYKDSMFRMLYLDKKELLSLYNAVNGTDYTDADSLEINTLRNAIYMNVKNDVSFLFNFQVNLYEQQSTVNPNMPLRDLFYVADFLKQNRAEAIKVSIYEYNEELNLATVRQEGYEDGLVDGLEQGITQGITQSIIEFLEVNCTL